MVCQAADMDCLMGNSSQELSGEASFNVSDIGDVWHIINLSTSVVLFIFSMTANASLIFALNKAKKQTFTATSLSFISKTDAGRMVLVYISCIPSAIAHKWMYGESMCKIMGYITTTIAIGQTVICLFMSIIRYLAISKPCLTRESSLYRAGYVVVLFTIITSVPAAGLTFLSSPNFDYIHVLHRCEMHTGWTSKVTNVLFIVIPSIITLVLAVATLWKIHVNKWSTGGIHNMGFKRRSGTATRPAIQEIRASRGIATVLTISSIMVLLNIFCLELSVYSSPLWQMAILAVSSVLFQAAPIVRSVLLITTSPVLRQVIVDTVLSKSQQDQVTPMPSKFKMIQGELAAPKPVYSREHRVTIHVEPHSENEEASTVVHRLRRLSSVSTVTCEVLCDGEKEACTVSICGDRGDLEDKEGNGSTDSVIVCIGSSFEGAMTSSICSLSEISQGTIVSSSLQHAGSFTRPRNRTSRVHRQSAVSLNSLSPLDVRYISQMDMTFDKKNKFPNTTVSVKTTPRKIPKSVPILLREKSSEDESDISAAKLAFYSDPEESQDSSKASPTKDTRNCTEDGLGTVAQNTINYNPGLDSITP